MSATYMQPMRAASQGSIASLQGAAQTAAFPFDSVLTSMVGAGLCLQALCLFLDLSQELIFEHIVRLGLPRPADKKFRRPTTRAWSVEDVRLLMYLRPAGVHPETIGKNLSKIRTANAVRAKCRALGLKAPPRSKLFRPDAAQLGNLLAGQGRFSNSVRQPPQSPGEKCGRPAGEPYSAPEPSRAAPAPSGAFRPSHRPAGGLVRSPGQQELPLLTIVADNHLPAQAESVPAWQPATPVPASCADIDFADLTWVGKIQRPANCEVAVFAVGMLFLAGMHYKAVARLVGKSVGALRTLRTRLRVPVERERKKLTDVFDLQVAEATKDYNKLVLRRWTGDGLSEFWWGKRGDATRLPYSKSSKRDRQIEGRSPEMTVITRAELDARAYRAAARPSAPAPNAAYA